MKTHSYKYLKRYIGGLMNASGKQAQSGPSIPMHVLLFCVCMNQEKIEEYGLSIPSTKWRP